jgi:hypothetical protein
LISALTITPVPIAAVPPDIVISPLIVLSTYVAILDTADFLLVPPAPSSTAIKSVPVNAAPMSVAPSISSADNDTLLAVDIVANFVSAIAALALISSLIITPEPIAAIPVSAIVISPDTTLSIRQSM